MTFHLSPTRSLRKCNKNKNRTPSHVLFGSYVEPVHTVAVGSVFFLDLSEFLRRPQYLYYVEANQSGSSQESLERENTFCTITFQKCKKIKKFNLVSTLLNEIYPKMH